MKGKLKIKTMSVTNDGQFVWITGRAQTPNGFRQDVSGSDFFEFDMTCKGEVNKLDEHIEIGDMIDIERDQKTGFWIPVASPGADNPLPKLGSCPKDCPKCKAVVPH